jgi:hypothetical protein
LTHRFAQQMIGKTLMYHPAGLVEILNLPLVAKTLGVREHDQVRRGLRPSFLGASRF